MFAALVFAALELAVLVFAAFRLNPLCFALSPVALGIVFFYSYTKRFTWATQFFLGLSLAVAMSATNVIDIAIFMLGLSSAELTANWGQWWWWRFNGKARLAASFGGPVVFLCLSLIHI